MRVSPLQFVVILLFVEIIAASPMEEQKSFHRQWPRIRLVLVRHGETEGNANGIVVGQETSPLTATGENQARALGQHDWFQKEISKAWRIYTSNLPRTQATAILAGIKKSDLCVSAALAELSKGARQTFPKDWDHEKAVEERKRKGLEVPLLESDEDGWKRLVRWLSSVGLAALDEDRKEVVVVAFGHAGLWRVFLRRLFGDEELSKNKRAMFDSPGRLRIPNTSVTIVELCWDGKEADQIASAASLIELVWTGHYSNEFECKDLPQHLYSDE